MEKYIKEFKELTTDELFEIYMARVDVFVVEQNCAYHEVDEFDRQAVHVFYKDNGKIVAYARVLPAGTQFENVAIGRVLALRRREGLGTLVVKEAIEAAKEYFGAEIIEIEAQTYAREMYEKIGFKRTSDEFLEDGIPHIKMELRI